MRENTPPQQTPLSNSSQNKDKARQNQPQTFSTELNPVFDLNGIGGEIRQEAEKHLEAFNQPFPDHHELQEILLRQVIKVDFISIAFPEFKERESLRDSRHTTGENGQLVRNPAFSDENQKRLDELTEKKFKVSQKQMKVIVIDELLKVATKNRWGLCQNNGLVYLFNGCYWRSFGKDVLESFLGKVARKMGVNWIDARECLFKSQLVEQFFSDAMLPRPEPVKGKVLINFLNGTLEITDGRLKLRNFEQNDFLTHQLPFDYNPKAEAPRWKAFLNEVLPDEDCQKVLAEFLGYSFVSRKRLRCDKALLLCGGGSNGKSVVQEVVLNMFGGSENVSGYSLDTLSDLEKGRSQRAIIADKLLNYGSELSSRLDPNMAKALISGDPVEVRRMYKDAYMIEDYAKMMFNCNELPKDTEQTHGFFRRFLIIPFKVTIPDSKQDRQLPQKIINSELSGVFNWVITGLNRLLEQNAFTESQLVEDELARFKLESDSVRMFLEDNQFEASPTEWESLKDLYTQYRTYCLEDGFKAVSKKTLNKRLTSIGIPVEGRINRVYVVRKSLPF